VLGVNVWRKLLGVDRATVIESVDFDEEAGSVVVHVCPRRSKKRRCGQCGRRAPGYDRGEGRRNWRALDIGVLLCHLQADAPRVNCPTHGPTVAQVPWARHTRDFDGQIAWLVTHTSKSAVGELLRVAWRTVGSIITRVVDDARAAHDPFDGLRRIGIDEISYRRGHKQAGAMASAGGKALVSQPQPHRRRSMRCSVTNGLIGGSSKTWRRSMSTTSESSRFPPQPRHAVRA